MKLYDQQLNKNPTMKYLIMFVITLTLTGCSLVPDIPGPIGIPGI